MRNLGILRSNSDLLNTCLRITDPLLAIFSSWPAFFFVFNSWEVSDLYLVPIIVNVLLVVTLFPFFKLYDSWRGKSIQTEIRALVFAWISVFVVLLLLSVITKTSAQYSRLWVGQWFIIGIVLLILFRLLLRYVLRWVRKRGFNQRHVIIVGSDRFARNVADQMMKAPWTGLNVVGFFDEAPVDNKDSAVTPPLLGGFDQLIEYVDNYGVDQVWLAMPWSRLEEINKVLYGLRHSTVEICMVPDIFGFNLLNASLGEVAGLPVLNLSSSPIRGLNQFIKTVEDRVLASIILILFGPLMIAIAIGVKLSSPGPVFYRQKRVGLNNKPFNMLKFRSMPVDAEATTGPVWAKPDDNRATKFGAFLRKKSLDELPQFINVLKGEMSIVGPRPERPVLVENFKDQISGYMKKHMVKAGITGWAQVNGWRGNTDLKKRIEYDLFYIENWSLLFDIKIIFLTIFKGFINKNAY